MRSRRRVDARRWSFRPDGSYAGSVPGPADKPQATGGGHWALEDGNTLVLPGRTLEVTEADADVLRVRER